MFNRTISHAFYYTFIAIAFLVGTFFVYIVVTKSPRFLRSYKNNLLNLTFWYFADLVLFLVAEPSVQVLNTQICFNSLSPLLQQSPPLFYSLFGLGVVSTANVAFAIVFCFLSRYVHLAHPTALKWFQSFPGTIFYVSSHAFCSLGIAVLSYLFVKSTDSVYLEDGFSICLNTRSNYAVSAFFCFLFSAMIFIFMFLCLFVLLSIRALRESKPVMRTKSYRLQNLLTVNLVVLTVLPTLFYIIPIIVSTAAVYLNLPSLEALIYFTIHLPFAEIILSWCATLYFVTPYRKAVLKLLKM